MREDIRRDRKTTRINKIEKIWGTAFSIISRLRWGMYKQASRWSGSLKGDFAFHLQQKLRLHDRDARMGYPRQIDIRPAEA